MQKCIKLTDNLQYMTRADEHDASQHDGIHNLICAFS